MESKQIAEVIIKVLDEKKAMDIVALDIHEKTGIADYFVICSGTSAPHTKSLSDYVEEKVKEVFELDVLRREGYQAGGWILLDYGSVVVQIFKPEEREYYHLEKLWGDSPQVDLAPIIGE